MKSDSGLYICFHRCSSSMSFLVPSLCQSVSTIRSELIAGALYMSAVPGIPHLHVKRRGDDV